MNDFMDKNLNKLLGSAGVLGIVHFVSQLNLYLADGKLDGMEIQQLLTSASSGLETVIVLVIVVYLRFFKK